MNEKEIEAHVIEITKHQRQLDQVPKSNKRKRIELLAEQLVYIGKLAAEFSEIEKETIAARHQAIAEAEDAATGNKKTAGELAAREWRKREAKAHGDAQRWKNAYSSNKELIHALKFDINIDIADGTISPNRQ